MTGALASLKEHCSLFLVRSESSTLTKSKPQLAKSTSKSRPGQASLKDEPRDQSLRTLPLRTKVISNLSNIQVDTFDAEKIPSACLSWNVGQT